ncbi:MAG: ankyrin repeat domain-containing protein [Epsilonproteobacteria bacterium]|nr:ankyrin repeat domain-containing protein [Campylobacterota bacterium]
MNKITTLAMGVLITALATSCSAKSLEIENTNENHSIIFEENEWSFPKPYTLLRSNDHVILLNEVIRYQSENIEYIKQLIAESKNLDEFDCSGHAALHIAVMKKEKEITQLLLDAGASVSLIDQFDWTPLLHAIWEKNREIAQELLSRGADINEPIKDGITPLHYAVSWGAESVKFVLNLNPNINVQDKEGLTPLHRATLGNNLEVIELLLKHGASKTITDSKNRTAADLAVEHTCRDMITTWHNNT